MKSNHVRAKLKHGDPSIGTWLTLPDPLAARMMARVGFDWLTVELEHAPTSFENAATSFAIIAASGPVPLARVPWNTGENIKRVLDTGAWGIVERTPGISDSPVTPTSICVPGACSARGASSSQWLDGSSPYPARYAHPSLVRLAPT